MKYIIPFIIAITALFTSTYAQSSTYGLTVSVNGITDRTGTVRAVLHNSRASFPDKAENAVRKLAVPVTDSTVQLTFTDLPADTYAVVLLHDRNDNAKMDYNFIGIPKEGYGISNNRTGKFKPPAYDDARFRLRADTTIQIQLIQ